MSALVNVPRDFSGPFIASFIAANGTLAKILVDVSPSSGAPGDPAFLSGGERVIDFWGVSSDGSNNALIIYEGTQATVAANTGTTAAWLSTSAILRQIGSYITEGISVGDMVMLFGAATAANNGLLLRVTAVTASQVTVNGTPLVAEATTWPAGARLVRVGLRDTVSIPLNSGNTTAVPNVQLINHANDPTSDRTGIELGATGMLIVAPNAAVSALPAVMQACAKVANR